MIKKDNFNFGMLMGLIVPVICFGVFYLLFYLIVVIAGIQPFIRQSSVALLSLAGNIVMIRYYFNNLKFYKSGKGLLLTSFVLFMLFFLLIKQWGNFHLPGLQLY